MVKTMGFGLLLVLGSCLPARAEFVAVNDFTDILFWSGSGANQAALVLYFDAPSYGDGGSPAAIAWGYRWDGERTQADMLFSLAGEITVSGSPPSLPSPQPGSDQRLAVDVEYFESFGLTGYIVTSMRYDQIGLPNPWQQIERVMDNTAPPPENSFIDIAPYAAFAGTGSEWPAGGTFDLIADTGISQTLLTNGGWYGFAVALYEGQDNGEEVIYLGFPATFSFAQPVSAVPEPSSLVLAACGGIVALVAWRRRPRLRTP